MRGCGPAAMYKAGAKVDGFIESASPIEMTIPISRIISDGILAPWPAACFQPSRNTLSWDARCGT